MEINLRPYQQELCDKTMSALETNNKVLVVAPTGSGKSVMIGWLANNLPGRTLVLTHRIEILNQNAEWIGGVGILTARQKIPPIKNTKVIISMSQTLWARINKYGKDYIGSFDNIISDEVHVDIFKKVYSMYEFNYLIGFTATPITNKKENKIVIDKVTGEEITYKRDLTMSRDFDTIVEGVTEQDLIELGYLTQDFNIALQLPNMDRLVRSESNPDGYTTDSLNEVYANTVAYDLLWEAYEKHCIGKKSIIFNATTKVNLDVYNYFKEKDVNCMCFDSVNKVTDMNRKEVIAWFKDEKEGVLINCNVFTTGFDITDIEVVILNRATKSLSLFLQMSGRGSRITDKIYKDKFTIIDMGQNFLEHGLWSLKRDWLQLFKPNSWKRKNPSDLLHLWECKECGYFNVAGEVMKEDGIHCYSCDALRVINHLQLSKKNGELVTISKPKPPKAKHLIQYTKKNNKNATFAFKILDKLILDLFIQHDVSKQHYQNKNGEFKIRIRQIYLPVYFAIIKDKELTGKKRKLNTQLENIMNKIDNHYNLN